MPQLQTKVPLEQQKTTHLDLSFDHVTTASFLRLQPIGYIHMIPNQTIDISSIVNVRPSPMPVPTYGRMSMHLRYFFVPYRLAFPKWESFKQDVISSNSSNSAIPVKPPYFDSSDIVDLFTNTVFGLSTVGSSSNYDFSVSDSNTYYKFTKKGRFIYKIFYSLGYDIVGYDSKEALEFNAIALLAWGKLYYDWYANSQYLDGSDVLAVQRLLEYNDPATPLHLSSVDMYNVLVYTYMVNFCTNSYFEDAWDLPNSPSANQFTSFNFSDITASGNQVVIDSSGNPFMQQTSATSTDIGSVYLHEALDKLSLYMKRHAISGAREIDRFLAEAGHKTDYLTCMRSIYVGNNIVDIGVGDVYATASSSNLSSSSEVGDYAGRAFGASEKTTHFTADEAGIFIVAASIIPSGGYYQGYDRHNRHLDKLDFFNGTTDGLSVQLLEKGEVYVSRNNASFVASPVDYSGRFGYIKRYGEYKRSISRVSGDIALPSLIAGGDSWHLMREFSDNQFGNNILNVVHSRNFSRSASKELFNRIFDYTLEDYDNFYVFVHFSVSSYSPCTSLFDVFEFDQDTKKQISLSVNGTKLN